ncbi:MAG: RsbRD N-terminal domain-containing protein [Nitrospirota bacterium]
MDLTQWLSERKESVVGTWFAAALETYPSETQTFLTTQKDQFHNPVGHTLREGLEAIFDELLGSADFDKIAPVLDSIIKIRALQEVPPSHAVAFVFDLKGVIRRELRPADRTPRTPEELEAFDTKIDDLALRAFDLYMKCRERLCEIRSNEVRNMTAKLVERANDIFERYCKESREQKQP